ncbi:MAG: DUF4097 family beta strand repeat-containing protein [Bacteroidota bacterium]
MKKLYKIQTVLSLLFLMFLASVTLADEQKKTFSDSFKVNTDAEVLISNEYGNVAIESWDRNEVSIEVVVSVVGRSEEKSKELLDKISVKIEGSPSHVEAVTKITGNLNCRNCSFNIDYEVKMPATNLLELKNSFGNVFIGDLHGSAEISVSYGNLTIGKLENKENTIGLKFGNVEIDRLKAADLNMEYGRLEIGSAGYLDLYVRFVGVEIGKVSEMILDGEYEGIEIGSVNMLRAKTSFMGMDIGELLDKIDLISTYGGVEISRVAAGFSVIDITAEFGGVELGISNAASYKLEASSSFGDVDYPESRAEVISIKKDSFETELKAFIGDDSSSSASVIIKVDNGSVEIH